MAGKTGYENVFGWLIELCKWVWFPPKKSDFMVSAKGAKPATHPYKELYATNDESFSETRIGFCFPWSLLIQDRKTGYKKGPVTREEFDEKRKVTRVDMKTGATTWTNVYRYFMERNYKIELLSVDDDTTDAVNYAAVKANEGSLVFLTLEVMWGADPATGYKGVQYGHIEAVLGLENGNVITNSWGEKAVCPVAPYLKHPKFAYYSVVEATIHLMICTPPK